MADTRTYPCTVAQLATLATMLASHGVTVDLTKPGEAQDEGWDIAWAFPDSAHVQLTVKEHPFAREGFLWSAMGRIFGG